jgi:thiamine-phosphate pyrophosphorylase
MVQIPRLYAILDRAFFNDEQQFVLAATQLASAGTAFIQLRDKAGNARQMLERARQLKNSLPGTVKLIMNDRADLCVAAEFEGVHVGQGDLSPAGARQVIGPDRCVGVSTHKAEQLGVADKSPADYIAFGPVFATSSKVNPDPVVGLEGLRRARQLTRKPLVAIGGITRENCRSVIAAGADSVAVISDLLRDPLNSARDFLAILG